MVALDRRASVRRWRRCPIDATSSAAISRRASGDRLGGRRRGAAGVHILDVGLRRRDDLVSPLRGLFYEGGRPVEEGEHVGAYEKLGGANRACPPAGCWDAG